MPHSDISDQPNPQTVNSDLKVQTINWQVPKIMSESQNEKGYVDSDEESELKNNLLAD